MSGIIEWIIALCMAIAMSSAPTPEPVEAEISSQSAITYSLDDAPTCWEDEVVVVVVHDPYGTSPGEGTLGCVPADDLPVNGYRP